MQVRLKDFINRIYEGLNVLPIKYKAQKETRIKNCRCPKFITNPYLQD